MKVILDINKINYFQNHNIAIKFKVPQSWHKIYYVLLSTYVQLNITKCTT